MLYALRFYLYFFVACVVVTVPLRSGYGLMDYSSTSPSRSPRPT